MLIDWFTVVAQAANFLILVWLMKRFLYKPILAAIDAREKRLADAQAAADAMASEAAAERDAYRVKNAAFDSMREEMHDKAVAESQAEHRRLFEQVRQDADEMRIRLHDKLDGEYSALHEEIVRRTQHEVIELTRKTLAELADADLEKQMAEVFVRRLLAMDSIERERLAAALKDSAAPLVVRSAFALADEQRTAITGAIQAALGSGNAVHFEVVPGLVGGIELLMHGEKIAWSIASHLASLEKVLDQLLKKAR